MVAGITQAAVIAAEIQQNWKFTQSKPTQFSGIHTLMHEHGIYLEQTDLAKSLYENLMKYTPMILTIYQYLERLLESQTK